MDPVQSSVSADSSTLKRSQLKNILIIVAMDVEEKAIIEGHVTEEIKIGQRIPIKFCAFKYTHHNIYVYKSGVGGVNAAIGLSFIIDKYPIDAVIALGVGGALAPQLEVGDLVISSSVIQHDSVFSGETSELMAPGHLFLSLSPEERVDPVMLANRTLADWLKSSWPSAHVGLILSGNELVGNTERKMRLSESHPGALLIDMEAGAIAQVSRSADVPFVIAKTVADRLHTKKGVSDDYINSLSEAARMAGAVLPTILKETITP